MLPNHSKSIITCLIISILHLTNASTPVIEYVSNDPYKLTRDATGSTQGGLTLYLHGSGFKTITSQVMIGLTACNQEAGDVMVTKTKIVCTVPKIAVGVYDVKVIVPATSGTVIAQCKYKNHCKLRIE